MADMLELIKQCAVSAVDASRPVAFEVGTVAAEKPLKVFIDQKKVLDAEFLVVPEHLTDKEVEVDGKYDTGITADHAHEVTIKKLVIKNALKTGETVLLMRMQGGKKYIVFDRVVRL